MNTRTTAEAQHKRNIDASNAAIEVQELKAAKERENIKQEFDLKKEKVADTKQIQMLKLQTVQEMHASGSFSDVFLNTSDDKEPIYGLIDKFIAMTKTE